MAEAENSRRKVPLERKDAQEDRRKERLRVITSHLILARRLQGGRAQVS